MHGDVYRMNGIPGYCIGLLVKLNPMAQLAYKRECYVRKCHQCKFQARRWHPISMKLQWTHICHSKTCIYTLSPDELYRHRIPLTIYGVYINHYASPPISIRAFNFYNKPLRLMYHSSILHVRHRL